MWRATALVVSSVLFAIVVVAAVGSDDPNYYGGTGIVDDATLEADGEAHRPHIWNRIVHENALPGSPSTEWDVNAAGDPAIQGYSTDISYNVGQVAEFKINTSSTRFRVDVYRMGYYKGLGARLHATLKPAVSNSYLQPDCAVEKETWKYDCANWTVTARWAIPNDTVSGVFIARLVIMDGEPNTWRADNSQFGEDPRFAMPGGESSKKPQPQPHAYGANGMGKMRRPLKEPRASLIYFVVRDDTAHSAVVFQTSDTVWQAYNHEGGTSTYGTFDTADPRPRCFKASLNRPLKTRATRQVNAYFGSEYPISRFLEANGYDVTYVAGVDTDRLGVSMLMRHKVFISAGHDEYWSGQQRRNIEAARDRGLHLMFLSGNEMFWRVRWEDNYRTMVVYKESQSMVKIDPNRTEWTGTFRDARSINPLGANPENAVTGQIFTMNAWRNDPLVVPSLYAALRQWRGTKVQRLKKGQRAVLHRGILGHEMDEDVDNGVRPAGLVRLSETEVDNVMYVQDHGSTYDSGSATHHLTLYRAPASKALVFGAGTVQWGWALDGFHDSESGVPASVANILNVRVGTDILAPERAIQQFTVNMLADMGVTDPNSLSPALKRAKKSTDFTPPACTVKAFVERPVAGDPTSVDLTVVVGAVDIGGGVVAAVEVQLGDGQWHPALPKSQDRMTWEYSERKKTRISQHQTHNAWCRAVDDSLNMGEVSLSRPEVPTTADNEERNDEL